jgi:hypothetical protein
VVCATDPHGRNLGFLDPIQKRKSNAVHATEVVNNNPAQSSISLRSPIAPSSFYSPSLYRYIFLHFLFIFLIPLLLHLLLR